MLEGSIISDRIFLPWNEKDLENEIFYFPEDSPYTDPEGMLPLTGVRYYSSRSIDYSALLQTQAKVFACWKRPRSFLEAPKMLAGKVIISLDQVQMS